MRGGAVTRLEAIWHFCRDHDSLLWRSARCGCFHCESLFPPAEIEELVDGMSTALCPRCGVDAVLPEVPLYVLNAELLREMHEAFFLSPLPPLSPQEFRHD